MKVLAFASDAEILKLLTIRRKLFSIPAEPWMNKARKLVGGHKKYMLCVFFLVEFKLIIFKTI